MKRALIIFIFVCLYLLTAFFGLGPVLFADGSMQERLLTLAVVILIFAAITYLMRFMLKKIK